MIKYLFLFLFIASTSAYAQTPKETVKKIGPNPIVHIDSIRVDRSQIQKTDPKTIAIFTLYDGKDAMDLFGEEGKDGVIYVETIIFAKKRFWRYFRSRSEEYAKLVPTIDSDSTIQYILDKKVLKTAFEGDLASITAQTFKEIKILSKAELMKDYQINDKTYGVHIITIKPDEAIKN